MVPSQRVGCPSVSSASESTPPLATDLTSVAQGQPSVTDFVPIGAGAMGVSSIPDRGGEFEAEEPEAVEEVHRLRISAPLAGWFLS